jgi:hypothetical protein
MAFVADCDDYGIQSCAFQVIVCHNTHQDDMSLGQVSPKLDEGSVIQDADRSGIVAFMSALLYDPMYTRHNQDCIALEASRVKDGNDY